jgi:hypothetical protein
MDDTNFHISALSGGQTHDVITNAKVLSEMTSLRHLATKGSRNYNDNSKVDTRASSSENFQDDKKEG